MQRQTPQTLTFGQKPLVPIVKLGLALLAVTVLTGAVLAATGMLPWEQLFPEHRRSGRLGGGSPVIWFACLAVVVPVYVLTRRQLTLEIGANSVTVTENRAVVWDKPCTGWRWRKSDHKYYLGIELLDKEGETYLIKTGGIVLGTQDPYLELAQALKTAGLPERDERVKAESLRAAPGTWIGLGFLVAAAVGFTWLVLSSLGGSPR
ncbi:hypothetical protein [Armatimonas sp.]|uniref:hypothetical protein n=1 Tax=Armatimonas sp. TaxID=1872638 RepID=UPI00286BA088|nr:hypothetical protein [Armatimonas sp.]